MISHVRVIFDFACIHFSIYECLKWLEKPLWLINIKFYGVIVTDTDEESQGVLVKMVFLTFSQNPQESVYVGVYISVFMNVSNGWKSHFGLLTLNFMVL